MIKKTMLLCFMFILFFGVAHAAGVKIEKLSIKKSTNSITVQGAVVCSNLNDQLPLLSESDDLEVAMYIKNDKTALYPVFASSFDLVKGCKSKNGKCLSETQLNGKNITRITLFSQAIRPASVWLNYGGKDTYQKKAPNNIRITFKKDLPQKYAGKTAMVVATLKHISTDRKRNFPIIKYYHARKNITLLSSKESNKKPQNKTEKSQYIGCFKDKGDPRGLAGRDLNGFILQSDKMNPQMCIRICKDKGFGYAAVQYGKFCFCRNSYGRYGKADNCNMVCAGDSTKICGGTWANSVYKADRYLKTATVAHYRGCFKDKGDPLSTKGRDLNGYFVSSKNMSIEKCMNICAKRGFRFAGLQYSKQCFCGNRYGTFGKSSACNMVCSNDPTSICGGFWANSIYEVGSDRGNTEAAQPKSSIKSDKSGFYLDRCRAYQNAHNYASNTVPAHLSRFKRAIHMTCCIHNPQENTVITAKWYYRKPSGQLLFINQYSVRVKDTGKKYLSYHIELPKGKNWPAGNYEVRLTKGGKLIKRVTFSIR